MNILSQYINHPLSSHMLSKSPAASPKCSVFLGYRDSLRCHKPSFGMFPLSSNTFSKLALSKNRGFVRCNIITVDSLAKDFWPKPVTIPETRFANPRAKMLCLEFWPVGTPSFRRKERWVRWMYWNLVTQQQLSEFRASWIPKFEMFWIPRLPMMNSKGYSQNDLRW